MSDTAGYSIAHVTRFVYAAPVTESVTELRMQPRSEGVQRCARFEVATSPRAHVFAYRDAVGNTVHHFDIPGRHTQLTVTATAAVEIAPVPALPERLPVECWNRLDEITGAGLWWDFVRPSTFARESDRLTELARQVELGRTHDPLTTLRRLCEEMRSRFDYVPNSTRVDSPIDEALEARRGVCQDFAHIAIALCRSIGIPCRYVSGYLAPDPEHKDRSNPRATHAWVEVLLPTLGWVGFDPTIACPAGQRHIRVAVGRDYADVPPTRGVFKGGARSELSVQVTVGPADSAQGEATRVTGWVVQEAYEVPSVAPEEIVARAQQQ
jgi:transglutaminase-like putative cysteine protease